MGWYFRKSKSFGPFRVNLSKSGLGVSTGVRGARLSVGPRGTYINLGRNGIYYRKKIGGRVRRKATNIDQGLKNSNSAYENQNSNFDYSNSIRVYDNPGAESVIGSSILKKVKKTPFIIFAWIYLSLEFLIFLKEWGIVLTVLAFFAFLPFFSVKAIYDLDSETEERWRAFGNSLISELQRCKKTWIIENEEKNIKGPKYGAGYQVDRGEATVQLIKPYRKNSFGFKSNIDTYMIDSRKCKILFEPSGIMVKKGSKLYSYSYDQFSMTSSKVRFAEDESVPRDAEIVGNRWRFSNKDGSPDLRFNDNRQLPICNYGVMVIQGSLIYLEFQTSNNSVPDEIAESFAQYKNFYINIENAKYNTQTDGNYISDSHSSSIDNLSKNNSSECSESYDSRNENRAMKDRYVTASEALIEREKKRAEALRSVSSGLEAWKEREKKRTEIEGLNRKNTDLETGNIKSRTSIYDSEKKQIPLTTEQRQILEERDNTVRKLGELAYSDLLHKELGGAVKFIDGQVYDGHAVLLFSSEDIVTNKLSIVEQRLNVVSPYKQSIEPVDGREFIIHLYMDSFKEINRELPLSGAIHNALIMAQSYRYTPLRSSHKINLAKDINNYDDSYSIKSSEDDLNRIITGKHKMKIEDPYDDLFRISDTDFTGSANENDNPVDDLMNYFNEEE